MGAAPVAKPKVDKKECSAPQGNGSDDSKNQSNGSESECVKKPDTDAQNNIQTNSPRKTDVPKKTDAASAKSKTESDSSKTDTVSEQKSGLPWVWEKICEYKKTAIGTLLGITAVG